MLPAKANAAGFLDFARNDRRVLRMTTPADQIIVALDVPTKEKALELVEKLRDQISFFKIGLQLYTAEGPEIVRAVLSTGAKVWLDLKLHDIPNTVARAVESASAFGVQMLTIHLSGGSEMNQVLRLAKLGVEAGIDGIVASPHEIKKLRAEFGNKIKIVVQGIRPTWAEPGDQKRFMTPRGAIEAGADYIGIGRPITTHPDPSEAVAKILQELAR